MMDVIHNYPGVAALMIGAILVFVTMFVSWWRVGRDPKPGFVIPRAEPPRGLSPTELSWVYGRGHSGHYFGRSVTAAVISLGVRGRLLIEEANGTIRLINRDQENAVNDNDLPLGERALVDKLNGPYPLFSLDSFHQRTIRKATANLHRSISSKLGERYFTTNWSPTVLGSFAATISLLFFYFLGRPVTHVAVSVGAHLIMSLILGFVIANVYAYAKGQAPQISPGNLVGLLVSGGSAIIIMTLFYSNVAVDDVWDVSIQRLSMLASACMGVSLSAFAVLMTKPTPEGRALLDEIEGFRFYLAAGGTQRLKMVDMPVVTTELFERLLPYAVALGVELNWSQAFEKQAGDTITGEQPNYRPSFYHGPSFRPGGITPFIAHLVGAIDMAHEDLMRGK